MKATLFDIVGEYQQLYDLATSEEEQAEQVFIDTLDSIKGELETKSAGYVAVINRLEAEQAKADEIAKTYAQVAKSRKNAIKRMKDTLLYAMDVMEVSEMAAGDMTIKVKNNGGQLPVIIEEGKDIPQNLCKVTIEPDKALIREYLKDHPECEFARIGERGKHIEVK